MGNGYRGMGNGSGLGKLMNASRHLAEVVEFLSFSDVDDGVGGVRRFKANAILVAAIGLNCKVAVNAGDDDIAACGAKRAVDH